MFLFFLEKDMSVRRVENGAGERKGGVAGRLAAVLSVGSTEGKRGRETEFEYGKEQVGTVMSELATVSVGRGLSHLFAPSLQY